MFFANCYFVAYLLRYCSAGHSLSYILFLKFTFVTFLSQAFFTYLKIKFLFFHLYFFFINIVLNKKPSQMDTVYIVLFPANSNTLTFIITI